MAKRNRDQKNEDILRKLRNVTSTKEEIFDDPTCVDGAANIGEEDEDDETVDLDWLLKAPNIDIVSEIVRCRKNKAWINLTAQFIGEDSDEFEYEFEIIEVEPGDVPDGVTVFGNNN